MEFTELVNFYQKNANWILQCFVIIFVALVLDFLQRRILKRVAARLEKTPNLWDDALVASILTPLSLLIWMLGLTSAVNVIVSHTDTTVFWFIEPLRNLSVIVILTWFISKFISQAEKNIIVGRQTAGKNR